MNGGKRPRKSQISVAGDSSSVNLSVTAPTLAHVEMFLGQGYVLHGYLFVKPHANTTASLMKEE